MMSLSFLQVSVLDGLSRVSSDTVASQAAAHASQTLEGLAEACGAVDRSLVCEQMYRWTTNQSLATAADWLLDKPVRIMLILFIAWIVNSFAKRAIVRFVQKIVAVPSSSRFKKLREKGPGRVLRSDIEKARAESRGETLGHVLRSVVVSLVWILALMLVLGEVGVNLGPLIAGAGIGGVALGFGAQSIVKDFLTGIFMLVEDNYGVGDVVDLGYATGVVEEVSLRSTTLRDVKGTVWHVPNGEISRVGNFSQIWSRAIIDIEVAYDTDLRNAMSVIRSVAYKFWEDPEWGGDELTECPDVWGVQALGSSGVVLRVAVKTEPSKQWSVERELRLRIKEAFDEAKIEIPFPQTTVWLRDHEHQLRLDHEHQLRPSEHSETETIANRSETCERHDTGTA